MPHARPEDFPAGGDGRWAFAGDRFRTVQWGDLEVGLTTVEGSLDVTEMYKVGGMPGGVCPCPHYGYIFSGRIRAVYPDSGQPDEVAVAGEAYFFPAGHVLVYEEPTKALEVNPAYALGQCMDAMARASERMTATASEG
jgi:hypothetical protein